MAQASGSADAFGQPVGFAEHVALPCLAVDSDGCAIYANAAWNHVMGEVAHGQWEWLAPVLTDDRERVRRVIGPVLECVRAGEVEFGARRADGSACVLLASLNPVVEEGVCRGALLVCWDVTVQRREENRLAFLAGHDPLTGLYNRRAFEEALDRAVARAGRGVSTGLVLLDMDHLKVYNDDRGHLDGDQALVNLSMLMRTHVRGSDLLARIGGDEFAILIEDADADEAMETAQRIRAAAASEEFVSGAREYRLGLSGGVAVIEPGVDGRVAVDRADAALYRAKAEGRDRIVFWEPSLGGSVLPDRLASRVRDAFSSDGFHLVFQPVVRLGDASVAYFESLVRMSTPGGPTLGPGEFLGVVDRLGLMPRLTQRVVDLALWALALAPKAQVSINLSSGDLGDNALLDDVFQAIEASEAARGRLVFELSEATLMSNLSGGRVWMERLSQLGCRFVLDDFGTGLGIFVLLREPHIEQVKLSRTVVRALSTEDATRDFVAALRELIESQGKAAVAAFVETRELLGAAQRAGFEWGQGYTLGEPSADLVALCARFGLSE